MEAVGEGGGRVNRTKQATGCTETSVMYSLHQCGLSVSSWLTLSQALLWAWPSVPTWLSGPVTVCLSAGRSPPNSPSDQWHCICLGLTYFTVHQRDVQPKRNRICVSEGDQNDGTLLILLCCSLGEVTVKRGLKSWSKKLIKVFKTTPWMEKL